MYIPETYIERMVPSGDSTFFFDYFILFFLVHDITIKIVISWTKKKSIYIFSRKKSCFPPDKTFLSHFYKKIYRWFLMLLPVMWLQSILFTISHYEKCAYWRLIFKQKHSIYFVSTNEQVHHNPFLCVHFVINYYRDSHVLITNAFVSCIFYFFDRF